MTKSDIKVKGSCCKDRPRCKTCPVVWKRLEGAGLAERTSKRTYVADPTLSKAQIRAARRGEPVPVGG